MAKVRSFKDFVQKQYFADIAKRVSHFVELHFHWLNFRSRSVKKIEYVSVENVELRKITSYDSLDNNLKFNVDVQAEIRLEGTSYGNMAYGTINKWFSVVCEVELNNGFKEFKVKDVKDYCGANTKPQMILTDALVPYLDSKNLDQHAGIILQKVYPEALESPTQINVSTFANRLGLKIKEAHLSRSHTIFGQMVFHDCTVEYFDEDKRSFGSYEVEGGTILADPEIFFLRTLGSWNNTVIHECIHWLKHRKAFELARMYGENINRIKCLVSEGNKTDKKKADIGWMEWHATALAPRVLMPLETFRKKTLEVIGNHKNHAPPNITPAVIHDLAKFFGVSAQSAKIRLIDIGYTGAIGALEYVDKGYVNGYSFQEGSIGKNQTFSISIRDSLKQYATNPDFKRTLDSGNFIYIDSHYCINAPKYVLQNEHGILEMTDYARTHMDECCLVFNHTTKPNPLYGTGNYSKHGLFHSVISENVIEHVYDHDDTNHSVEARAAAIRAEMDEALINSQIIPDLPASFCKSLIMLMEWRGLTNEDLAEKSKISVKTIQRMRNSPERSWDLELLASVCVGLQLPPYISYPLIGKAGLNLNASRKGVVFAHVLTTQYSSPIYEVNEYLEVVGYSLLNTNEK